MDLSWTLSQTSRHVEMVCVRKFSHGEVSVKVGVMEFGLMQCIRDAVVSDNDQYAVHVKF